MPTIQGIVPLRDPNRGWRDWEISEIYTGPNGTGEYVPNVNDRVTDMTNRRQFRVSAVDVNHLSTLVDWVLDSSESNLEDLDILLGVGPGYTSERWRVYVNDAQLPRTLTVDALLKIAGSANTHIKVFKGTTIAGANAKVISAWYDQNGVLVSENIPLELATDVNGNVTTKVARSGWSTESLQDGEVVTMVVYNDQGGQSGIYKLLVKNTRYVRASEASSRLIEQISIRSPFLSQLESDTLEVPLNVPLESVAMMGVLHYSDGSRQERPIDGTKFVMHGLDAYSPTINGQKLPIALTYKLGPTEPTVLGQPGSVPHITRPYQIKTVQARGAYTVKLFVVPNWISEIVGWRLEYFLYDLDRQDFYYATPFVEGAANSRPFNPLEYNTLQRLNVAVNLQAVDARLADFRHHQVFDIVLYGNGVEDRTPWTINYDAGQEPTYGMNLSARFTFQSIDNWLVDVSCGAQTLMQWLQRVYFPIQPLIDSRVENSAPIPTHFILEINGVRKEHSVNDFAQPLVSITGGSVGRAASLEWIRKVGSTTLHLGHSPLVIVHTN